MEVLFFINGILTLIVVGITYLNLKLKSKIDDLETDTIDHQYNTSYTLTEVNLSIIHLNNKLSDINDQLNTDEYQNISGLSSTVSELNKMSLAVNKKVDDLGREHEKQTSVLFSEVQQLKNNLKGLNQNDFR